MEWLPLVIIVLTFVSYFMLNKGKEKFCTDCHTTAKTKIHIKGSFVIEIILWICFFIPGLIYTIWRSTSKEEICSHCKSNRVIPLDSPLVKKILAQNPTNITTMEITNE